MPAAHARKQQYCRCRKIGRYLWPDNIARNFHGFFDRWSSGIVISCVGDAAIFTMFSLVVISRTSRCRSFISMFTRYASLQCKKTSFCDWRCLRSFFYSFGFRGFYLYVVNILNKILKCVTYVYLKI